MEKILLITLYLSLLCSISAASNYVFTTRISDQQDNDREYKRMTEQRKLDIEEYRYTVQAKAVIDSSANYAKASVNVQKDI